MVRLQSRDTRLSECSVGSDNHICSWNRLSAYLLPYKMKSRHWTWTKGPVHAGRLNDGQRPYLYCSVKKLLRGKNKEKICSPKTSYLKLANNLGTCESLTKTFCQDPKGRLISSDGFFATSRNTKIYLASWKNPAREKKCRNYVWAIGKYFGLLMTIIIADPVRLGLVF